MRAQRNCVTVRIHLFVVEVVVPLRIGAELWIVFVRSEYEWGSASPTSHQLCGDQFLFVGCAAVLAEKVTKSADVLLEPSIGHVTAVSGKNLQLWSIGHNTFLVGIPQNEFAGLQRRAGTRRGLLARTLDDRLR